MGIGWPGRASLRKLRISKSQGRRQRGDDAAEALLTRLDATRRALHDPDAIRGAVDVRHKGVLRIRQQKPRREARWRQAVWVQASMCIMMQMALACPGRRGVVTICVACMWASIPAACCRVPYPAQALWCTAEARPLSLHAARTCPSHSGRLFPVSSCKFGSGWAEHCYRYGIKGGEGGAQVHGCPGIRHSSGGSMLISLLSSVTRKARPVHRSADPLANKCRSGAPGHPRMRLANTSRCRIRSLAVDVNGGEMDLPKSGSGWPVGKNNAEGGHPCVL